MLTLPVESNAMLANPHHHLPFDPPIRIEMSFHFRPSSDDLG